MWLVPGVGVEPTIRAVAEADFKSAAFALFATPAPRNRNSESRGPRCSEPLSSQLEATGGFEPPIGVLQTPALTSWPRRPSWSGRRDSNPRPPPWQGGALPLSHFRPCPSWCRGGDLNPYALSGTAPSRRRVYLFHHLGSSRFILHVLPRLTRPRRRRRTVSMGERAPGSGAPWPLPAVSASWTEGRPVPYRLGPGTAPWRSARRPA